MNVSFRPWNASSVTVFWLSVLAIFSDCSAVADEPIRIVRVEKIWDAAPHNAFTDLERFHDQWVCAFREADGHVGAEDFGKLRVIGSADGRDWKSLALLEVPKVDLRDAKLSITPSGELLLNSCEYTKAKDTAKKRHNQSVTFLSKDGKTWEGPHRIADHGYWLWQTTWRGDTGYSLGYQWGADDATRFYTTKDGKTYKKLVDHIRPPGDRSNEHAMIFAEQGRALMLLRRDNASSISAGLAMLGSADAPYRDWEWRRLPISVGGPSMIQIPDGRVVICVRRYENEDHANWGSQWTEVGFLDPKTAKYTASVKLPSGGDSSYAGMFWRDDRLWMSYYSSHEGKTAIYFAELEFAEPATK